MPTAQQIREQLDNLPDKYIFWTKKEVNYLPQVMVEGEELRALTSGYSNNHTVLAACTNRRILFLDKGMFFGLNQSQVGLDRVQAIDGSYKIFFGSIRIWDGAAAINLNMVLAKSIDPFIRAVRTSIEEYKRISFKEVTGAATDVAGQIERLVKLLDSGHLSAEEFETQKHKILQMG